MIKTTFLNLICCIAIYLKCIHPTNAQEDNEFPLVAFDDFSPSIDIPTQKTYITTVGLVPDTPTSIFDEAAFIQSAIVYYSDSAGLCGYINVENIFTQLRESVLLVTYQVRYDFLSLTSDPAVDDSKIQKTIGNYAHVRAGIENAESLTKHHSWSQSNNEGKSSAMVEDVFLVSNYFTGSGGGIKDGYEFEPDGENFQFSGKSLCTEHELVSCNGSHAICNETIDGVSISCTSPCKLEYCRSNGICKQEDPDTMPVCMCLSTYSVWYVGEYCQTKAALWMVILDIVMLCLFMVLTFLFAVSCMLARRKKTNNLHHKNFPNHKQSTELNTFSHKAFNHSIADNIPQATKSTQTTPSTSRHAVRRRLSRDSLTKQDFKERHRRQKTKASAIKAKTNPHKEAIQKHRSTKASQSRRKNHHQNRNDIAFSNASFVDNSLATMIPAPIPSPRKKKALNEKIGTKHNSTVNMGVKPTSPIRWLPVQETSNESNDLGKLSKNKLYSNYDGNYFTFNQVDTIV